MSQRNVQHEIPNETAVRHRPHVSVLAVALVWLMSAAGGQADERLYAFVVSAERKTEWLLSRNITRAETAWTTVAQAGVHRSALCLPKHFLIEKAAITIKSASSSRTEHLLYRLDLVTRARVGLLSADKVPALMPDWKQLPGSPPEEVPPPVEISIAPDGLTLAFSGHRGPADAFDLYIMDLASGKVTKVSDGDNYDEMPVWSPDGRYLVFYRTPSRIGHGWQSGETRRGYALWVWNRQTAQASELVPASPHADDGRLPPAWSPDGSKVAFVWADARTSEPLGLYVLERETRRLTRLTSGAPSGYCSSYCFSPDGTDVLYVWKGQIYACNVDRPAPRHLLSGELYYRASFTSDGTKLILCTTRQTWLLCSPDGSHKENIIAPAEYRIHEAFTSSE